MGVTEIIQACVSPAGKLIVAVSGAIGKAYVLTESGAQLRRATCPQANEQYILNCLGQMCKEHEECALLQ